MSTQQRRPAAQAAAPQYEFGDAHQRANEHKSLNQRTAILIPEGVKMWQSPKTGNATIDIMPYRVGEGNPHEKPGKIFYERTYFCHQKIGPNNGSTYICAFSVFGERCAVCDYMTKEVSRPDANKQLLTAWKTKERQLFWIVDHADMKSGLQLWDCSYHLFGKRLDDKMKAVPKYKLFFHPVTGYTLTLRFEAANRGGYNFTEVTNIEMEQRAKPYPLGIIEKAKCLDDLLVKTPYKDLAKILTQVGGLPEEESIPADASTESGFDLYGDGGTGEPTATEGNLEADFPFDTPADGDPGFDETGSPMAEDNVFPADEADAGFEQAPDVDADAGTDFDLGDGTTPADEDFPFEGNADDTEGMEDAFVPEPEAEPEPEEPEADPNMGFAKGNFVTYTNKGNTWFGTIDTIQGGVAKISRHPDKTRDVKNCQELKMARRPAAKPAATAPAAAKPTAPAQQQKKPAAPTATAKPAGTKPATTVPNKRPAAKK